MVRKKSRFALFFGNRAFFPSFFQKEARSQIESVLKNSGHKTIKLGYTATNHGAVETVKEGKIYFDFLEKNRGNFDGIILCLPNFGDENGAVAALRCAGVPILVQAYPDELDKMKPQLRRDAFCGKFSIMDVFVQNNIPFTALKPHTVHPENKKFSENIDYFDRLCRVVSGLRGMVVGAIGARTTAFKTVRIDELTLQKHGITVETVDLSDVFARMNSLKNSDRKVKAKATRLKEYSTWKGVPDEAFQKLVKLGVSIDSIVEEFSMDAVAIRCWLEMQEQLGLSPCVLLSEMNDRGLTAACEVDIGNAVTMHALSLASGNVSSCLDWNNNYGDEEDKCILFHCGPVPQSMMARKGRVTDHAIIANVKGEGCAYGCNVGRISPTAMTFGSLLTDAGRLKFYLGQGEITKDPIAEDFFGCAGVAKIQNLQDKLQQIGYMGHRHHVSLTPGHVLEPLKEALEKYICGIVTVL